jgi:hypothetical protein
MPGRSTSKHIVKRHGLASRCTFTLPASAVLSHRWPVKDGKNRDSARTPSAAPFSSAAGVRR